MITLVTGGARSGKSSFAEKMYLGKDDVVYIATCRSDDTEMEKRIESHRNLRPKCWRTYENTYNLNDAVALERYYILDCLTVLMSNIMYDMSKDMEIIDDIVQRSIEDKIIYELEKLIKEIKESNKELVIVTNEVGSSIVPENHIARVYRDIAGRINQRAAEISDEVYAVICGLPLRIK